MRWTPKEAAAAWNCSLATAYRLLKKHPEAREQGAPKPETKRGNPFFGTSEFQRKLAGKRWEGHVSKAQARLIVRGLVELEMERAAAWAAEYIGNSAAPTDEEWEPYPEPEDIEGYEPTEPYYTEKSLQEAAERRKARQPRRPD